MEFKENKLKSNHSKTSEQSSGLNINNLMGVFHFF